LFFTAGPGEIRIAAWILLSNLIKVKPIFMARQNNRNPQRDRRSEERKTDVAGSSLRYDAVSREPRFGEERGRDARLANLNKYEWNDLYERSSI
jgi:hypothetical protein